MSSNRDKLKLSGNYVLVDVTSQLSAPKQIATDLPQSQSTQKN